MEGTADGNGDGAWGLAKELVTEAAEAVAAAQLLATFSASCCVKFDTFGRDDDTNFHRILARQTGNSQHVACALCFLFC